MTHALLFDVSVSYSIEIRNIFVNAYPSSTEIYWISSKIVTTVKCYGLELTGAYESSEGKVFENSRFWPSGGQNQSNHFTWVNIIDSIKPPYLSNQTTLPELPTVALIMHHQVWCPQTSLNFWTWRSKTDGFFWFYFKMSIFIFKSTRCEDQEYYSNSN